MKKAKKKYVEFVICECGYNNQPENVARYGTCRFCNKVLDEKVFFKREMNKRLRLWRKKK